MNMKKIMAALSLFLILINNVNAEKIFSLKDYFVGEYASYSYTPLTENYIYLGSCYMNIGDDVDTSQLIGESMTIQNFEPASAINLLDATIIKMEYLETGATIFYCYTDLISRSVTVDNKKANLQIAYYDTYSVIGWPMILGSF